MTLTITHQVLRYVFRNTKESEFAIKDNDNEPRSFKKQNIFIWKHEVLSYLAVVSA